MNADAPALLARARGLRRRLAPVDELVALAEIDSPAALLTALAERRFLPVAAPGRGDAEALEAGHRRRAAELLGILERWRGRGRDVLALVAAEEERRALRSLVRGVAMNPIDHPHGGGEGKTAAGRDPVSPWGTLTKGYRTRKNKRTSGMIVNRRHQK